MKTLKVRARDFGGISFRHEDGYIVITGNYEFEEIDDAVYVQVQFLGGDPYFYQVQNKLYTYVDPGFNLRVGDLVDVPTRYSQHNVAIVKKLGDGFTGQARKEVNGKYALIENDNPVETAYQIFSERLSNGEYEVYAGSGCGDGGCFCDPSNGDECW